MNSDDRARLLPALGAAREAIDQVLPLYRRALFREAAYRSGAIHLYGNPSTADAIQSLRRQPTIASSSLVVGIIKVMSTAIQLITLEEFIARPDRDDDQREELIEGELIVSPAAKVWHSAIVRRLRVQLAALESPSYGFVLSNDFACITGKMSMPAPDLAAVSVERWNQAEDRDGWLDGSPELVVEVASPSNRKLQRKAALYLEHGAEQVWIVYRKTKTVTLITPEGTSEARMGESLEFHGVGVTVEAIMTRTGN